MEDWTQEILPQHGSFVRSIFVRLSLDDIYTSDPPISNIDVSSSPTLSKQDNDPSEFDRLHNNFLEMLIDSLALCTNATFLEIQLLDDINPPEADSEGHVNESEMEKFLVKLIPQISRLKGLRGVRLDPWLKNAVMNTFLPLFIKSLPMLESFSNQGFTTSIMNHGQESIEWDLTPLQHLTKLHLKGIPLDNFIWHLDPRPQRIKTLDLFHRTNQIPSAAVFHHIAPNLEQLVIWKFTPSGTDEQDVALTTALRFKDRLSLPLLHRLSLVGSIQFLICFTDCKALKNMMLLCESAEDFWVTQRVLRMATWPHLKHVILSHTPGGEFNFEDPDIQTKLVTLKDFCGKSNIKLTVS